MRAINKNIGFRFVHMNLGLIVLAKTTLITRLTRSVHLDGGIEASRSSVGPIPKNLCRAPRRLGKTMRLSSSASGSRLSRWRNFIDPLLFSSTTAPAGADEISRASSDGAIAGEKLMDGYTDDPIHKCIT